MGVFKVKCVLELIIYILVPTSMLYPQQMKTLQGNPKKINTPYSMGAIPYHALVAYGRYFCSGAVIGSRVVLTSAYCFNYLEEGAANKVVVKVGAESMAGDGQVITVSSIKMHEYFNKKTPIVNDIALLCLERHINLMYGAQKTILVEPDEIISPGTQFTVTSWINNNTKRELKRQLTTKMVIINQSFCASKLQGYITASSFCARNMRGNPGIIADIGGPAVLARQLIGVMTFTEKINDMVSIAVFTNISRFYRWIRKNTVELLAKYCVEDEYADYYDAHPSENSLLQYYDISYF